MAVQVPAVYVTLKRMEKKEPACNYLRSVSISCASHGGSEASADACSLPSDIAMPDSAPEDHLPLRSVEVNILLSVVDRPRHGYAILQEAEERAGGRAGFEIPTLYRALRRLRAEGLIQEVDAPVPDADERRDYWVATPLGRRVLRAELARLQVLLATGRARTGPVTRGEG